MRRSDKSLAVIALGVVLAALTAVDARLSDGGGGVGERARLTAALQLTDFALFTEARYTRHPSQADLHSAFQDHPMALDHFPSGSFRPPPDFRNLARTADEDVD